jgi:hypothetical protein
MEPYFRCFRIYPFHATKIIRDAEAGRRGQYFFLPFLVGKNPQILAQILGFLAILGVDIIQGGLFPSLFGFLADFLSSGGGGVWGGVFSPPPKKSAGARTRGREKIRNSGMGTFLTFRRPPHSNAVCV